MDIPVSVMASDPTTTCRWTQVFRSMYGSAHTVQGCSGLAVNPDRYFTAPTVCRRCHRRIEYVQHGMEE